MIKREVIVRYIIEVPDTTTYNDVKEDVQEALKQRRANRSVMSSLILLLPVLP